MDLGPLDAGFTYEWPPGNRHQLIRFWNVRELTHAVGPDVSPLRINLENSWANERLLFPCEDSLVLPAIGY